jgi:hypothetical protein
MGTKIRQNTTTFNRCPKDEQHPFCRIPANLFELDGYKLAIMAQILSNKDGWNIVKYEICRRLGFPERKFLKAWRELEKLGYIQITRKWGCYHYTIFENLDNTTGTGADCADYTTGNSTGCTGATLTTINNNYYSDVTATTGGTSDEGQFNELLNLYPSRGTRVDGTNYNLKSRIKECKRFYLEYLRSNIMTHEEIMTALRVELNDKEISGKMHFQPGLLRWIEDKVFEQYKGRILEPFKLGYGTELS